MNNENRNFNHLFIKISIIIWLTMTSGLNLFFSSVLLSSYSKFTPKVIVENIEDVIENKELNIAGISQRTDFNELNKLLSQEDLALLFDRINIYSFKMKIGLKDEYILNDRIVFDIIDGKAILIADTFQKNKIIDFYDRYRFRTAKKKYFKEYFVYKITKNHKFAETIRKMLRNAIEFYENIYFFIIFSRFLRCIENGLFEHTLFLRKFKNQLFGKHFKLDSKYFLVEDMAEVKQLDLENVLRNPFLSLIIGEGLAIIFFILEKLSKLH